jgi:ABC-type multidrug transport system ATPase subunit
LSSRTYYISTIFVVYSLSACRDTNRPARHRLSTIITSDQIIVLHKGKIVERGTHADLLEAKGSYHAMWEKQTTAEKKAAEAAAETKE